MDEVVRAENVKVELRSEVAISREPAWVRVYDGNRLVVEIIAQVEPKMGADGGYYSCVTLKQKQA